MNEGKITIRSLILGTFFSAAFAVITVAAENPNDLGVTANQIAVLPYALLLLSVLLINPVCRLLRFVRRFTVTEILVVFIMCSVSAGISTYGLASQLMPSVGNLYHEGWNNDQTEWNLYIEPYLNENYFLSVPGIQAAAVKYRDAVEKLKDAQGVYRRAMSWKEAEAKVAECEERLVKAKAATGPDAERKAEVSRAEQLLETAHQARAQAQKEWNAAQQRRAGTPLDRDAVIASYPALIEQHEAALKEKKDALVALEKKAADKVRLFRRGLPKDMRAFPGFFYMPPDDNAEIYAGRVRRLVRGISALDHLTKAQALLESAPPAATLPPELAGQAKESVQAAIDRLRPSSQSEGLEERKQALDSEWQAANQELLQVNADLKLRRQERRLAQPEEFDRLDGEISRLDARAKDLQSQKDAANRAKEQVQAQLDAAARVATAVADLEVVAKELGGEASGAPSAGYLNGKLAAAVAQFPAFDASLKRFLIGDLPWTDWFGILARWALLISLTYLVLMALNVLIFRQWAHNERLIYPLAKLPEILAGTEEGAEGTAGRVPAVFKNGLFWIGVAVSASVMGWNLLCYSNVVPGLKPMDVDVYWRPYIENSSLQGLIPSARSTIFFTMIGLAFMIPAEISFSLWFFYLLYMVQLLVLVWSGYGVNEDSFPKDWWYILNFKTAEGGGALMVFAAFILHKCRRYICCSVLPGSVAELEAAERRELRISSALFILGSVGLVFLLWRGLGVNLWYTIFAYFVIIAISIGLARAVTEGGILGFQAWVSPFHFIRTVFGMDKSWTSPALYAPLLVYYNALFLDIKAFIVPSMANSIKIRDDMKMKRLRFHLAIVLGILIAMAAALVTHVMMAYDRGADGMEGWFYSAQPNDLFGKIKEMVQATNPVDNTANAFWLGFGMVLMAGLLYLRRFLFWLPHPIGLIMLVNPLMSVYWFPLFLGWIAKSLTTKYGNKDTYYRVRNFFIGLIVGELLICVLAVVVALLTGSKVYIDLNRK